MYTYGGFRKADSVKIQKVNFLLIWLISSSQYGCSKNITNVNFFESSDFFLLKFFGLHVYNIEENLNKFLSKFPLRKGKTILFLIHDPLLMRRISITWDVLTFGAYMLVFSTHSTVFQETCVCWRTAVKYNDDLVELMAVHYERVFLQPCLFVCFYFPPFLLLHLHCVFWFTEWIGIVCNEKALNFCFSNIYVQQPKSMLYPK